LKKSYPYIYLDGIYLKRNWGGTYENVAVLVAMAVNERGRQVDNRNILLWEQWNGYVVIT
jgi:transposase-like protein